MITLDLEEVCMKERTGFNWLGMRPTGGLWEEF